MAKTIKLDNAGDIQVLDGKVLVCNPDSDKRLCAPDGYFFPADPRVFRIAAPCGDIDFIIAGVGDLTGSLCSAGDCDVVNGTYQLPYGAVFSYCNWRDIYLEFIDCDVPRALDLRFYFLAVEVGANTLLYAEAKTFIASSDVITFRLLLATVPTSGPCEFYDFMADLDGGGITLAVHNDETMGTCDWAGSTVTIKKV